MNETVKIIVDKIDKIKDFCDDITTIIDIFQYNCSKYNNCNSVEYKQLKQDIRANTKQIDNLLEEINSDIFKCQLKQLNEITSK